MSREKARISNVRLCSLTNVAWYDLCLFCICWWPEGLQVKSEDSTSQYEQVHVYSVGFCDPKFKY